MRSLIPEAALEMHFHGALMDTFKNTCGLGVTGNFEFFKYSIRKEKFVGFDQAYVMTELADREFFESIKNIAAGNTNGIIFTGYFLQFKTVGIRLNRSKKLPGLEPDFYEVKLSTDRDKEGNFSQHEMLRNIARSHQNALCYYACPMIFDKCELYGEADPDKLRLVEVSSAPSDYTDNKSHHIYFNEVDSDPVWYSEPREGVAISISQMTVNAAKYLENSQHSAKNIVDALKSVGDFESEKTYKETLKKVAEFFYLIRISEK
jgi:hypothetical protein